MEKARAIRGSMAGSFQTPSPYAFLHMNACLVPINLCPLELAQSGKLLENAFIERCKELHVIAGLRHVL